MKYVSTRNQSVRLRASQAIAQGLARDGGLLTPEVFPKLTPALLEDLRGKTYGQRAVAVMKLFLEDFSEEELTAFTQAGYSGEKFDDAAPHGPGAQKEFYGPRHRGAGRFHQNTPSQWRTTGLRVFSPWGA